MSTNAGSSVSRKMKRHGMNIKSTDPSETWGTQTTLYDFDDGSDQNSAPSLGSKSSLATGSAAYNQLMEQDKERGNMTLVQRLMEIPGLILYPIWLTLYALVCLVTKKLADKASCKGKVSAVYTQEDLDFVKPYYQIAAACFSVVILVELSFMVFQISAKKRMLGSLVMVCACVCVGARVCLCPCPYHCNCPCFCFCVYACSYQPTTNPKATPAVHKSRRRHQLCGHVPWLHSSGDRLTRQ